MFEVTHYGTVSVTIIKTYSLNNNLGLQYAKNLH